MDSGRHRTTSTQTPPLARPRPTPSRTTTSSQSTPPTSTSVQRPARSQSTSRTRHRMRPSSAVSRLAADLHDHIAQSLWSADVDIDSALACLPPNSDEAREHLLASRRTIGSAYQDIRLTIGALRANLPFQRDLAESLKSRLVKFSGQTGIAASFTCNHRSPQWSRFVQLHVLAIVQQGLDNVLQHAMASHVVLTLDRLPKGWSLTLRDDGRGFQYPSPVDHTSTRHYGLTTMRERAESFGGSFAIQSTSGQGTTLTIFIPDSATPRD
jgi:signal transduction histidine kinase